MTSVIAKLEPGGAQLGVLRKLLALRAREIESRVIAAEATTPGIGLFTDHGIGVEVWGRCSGMQYACRADFGIRVVRSRPPVKDRSPPADQTRPAHSHTQHM